MFLLVVLWISERGISGMIYGYGGLSIFVDIYAHVLQPVEMEIEEILQGYDRLSLVWVTNGIRQLKTRGS